MEQAVDDEARHIGLCDQVAKDYGWPGDPSPPTPHGPLGPEEASFEDRLLYEMVAFCCVTETLNTSMLLAIHRRVVAPDIKAQVHAILKDEVNHSRVGWAYLQYRRDRGDGAQLTDWLPNMFHGAGIEEVYSPDSGGRDTEAMADYGESSLKMRTDIFEAAVRDVIFPGLERVGVDTRPSQMWLETFKHGDVGHRTAERVSVQCFCDGSVNENAL